MKIKALVFLFLIFQNYLSAQEDISVEPIRIPMINLNMGFHSPGGDLADRFGSSSMFGIGFQLKNNKNFYWGFDFSAIAGADVREDNIIDIITADSLDIIDVNGNTASIRFWERGAQAQLVVGKIFPYFKVNNNSGIFVQAGFGYMYHKIRIEDIGNLSPQLNEDMREGYDRLSMGYSISQFIGYRHFSNNRRINFFVGVEFIQAFTENVRKYDYNAQSIDEEKRIDLLNGFKFGWTFPLYKQVNNQYYYY